MRNAMFMMLLKKIAYIFWHIDVWSKRAQIALVFKYTPFAGCRSQKTSLKLGR